MQTGAVHQLHAAAATAMYFSNQTSRELVNEPRLRWHFAKHTSRASDWGKAERAVPSLLSAFLFCGSVLPLTS